LHCLTKLWHRLMPTIPMKVHAWQHLLEDLKKYRGMKSHGEQQIEREHQKGKKHDKRLKCFFRDFEKKTMNILRHNATADSAQVQAMQEDTEAKRIRKKKKRKLEELEEGTIAIASSGRRNSRRHSITRVAYLALILELPPIQDDFPSLLELAKLYRRVEPEVEVAVEAESDDEED